MAKPGRRERKAKRERLLRERQLRLAIVSQASNRSILPARELSLLINGRSLGALRSISLDAANIKGKIHTKNAYIGRATGSRPIKHKPMPERFKTQFMAYGHEKLKTAKTDNRTMVRVGTTQAHNVVTVDKATGEKVFFKVPARPKWAIVGHSSSVPKSK